MQLDQRATDAERRQRNKQLKSDSLLGIALGIPVDQAVAWRKTAAREWVAFFEKAMADAQADSPQEVLPLAFAALESKCAEQARTIARIAAKEEISAMLKRAIK